MCGGFGLGGGGLGPTRRAGALFHHRFSINNRRGFDHCLDIAVGLIPVVFVITLTVGLRLGALGLTVLTRLFTTTPTTAFLAIAITCGGHRSSRRSCRFDNFGLFNLIDFVDDVGIFLFGNRCAHQAGVARNNR